MFVRIIYKIVRSIIFSLTLFVVGMYVLTYILISIPTFTDKLKQRIGNELSELTGGEVEIEQLRIYPFNEVSVEGLSVNDPEGVNCLYIDKVGAGIGLWKLITEGKIELTYGEIIGLKVNILQLEKDSALNIAFLIDAFKPKEESKEKKQFELALRNVVIRKSSVTFLRPWRDSEKLGSLDLGNLKLTDLAADITFPKISDKGVTVDLRRLSFNLPGVTKVEKIGLKGTFGEKGLSMKDFVLLLPSSKIFIPEIELNLTDHQNFQTLLKEKKQTLQIYDSYVTPADFAFLYQSLSQFTEPLDLDLLVTGNLSEMKIEKFNFGNPAVLDLTLRGGVSGLEKPETLAGNIKDLKLDINHLTFERFSRSINLPPVINSILKNVGNLNIQGDFSGFLEPQTISGNIELESDLLSMTFEGDIKKSAQDFYSGTGELNLAKVQIQKFLPNIPVNNINLNLVGEGTFNKYNPEGMISLVVEDFSYKGKSYEGFSLNLEKDNDFISGDFMAHNEIADIESEFKISLKEELKKVDLEMGIERINLSELTDLKKYNGYLLSGDLKLEGEGRNIDFFTGDLNLERMRFSSPDNKHRLQLTHLDALASVNDSISYINLNSDWIDAKAEGSCKLKDLPNQLINLVSSVYPVLISPEKVKEPEFLSDLDFDVILKHNNALSDFLNLPLRLLVPVTLSGTVNGTANTADIILNAPYLQQGKDKLIYDTKLWMSLDGNQGELDALIETNVPVKKGDLSLNVNLFGRDNKLSTDLHWINTENPDFKGHLLLDTELSKNPLTSKPEICLDIQPSVVQMGDADWNISRSRLTYTDKYATVSGLKIWHDNQFVEIEGTASPEYADAVKITLEDIDVDYVFDMLQINYVTFGGTATGEISGHSLLSGDPVAETDWFVIKDFTYNGADLGTCVATSKWNNEEKEIEISADISYKGKRCVFGSGGIWLGQDSLFFNIEADKVPVDFVQPFMAVFSSHVGGFATGAVKLFGNFHDIDMTGKIFADSVAVKLDYTNTVYHGSDSVFLNPGRIEIPGFRLYDKNGNSAVLTGELTHRFFHDPSFTFRLNDAVDFLCYDTNKDLNPDWYGVLYGTGSANLQGVPGLVDISADMTITSNSSFTFVLNETEYARDYQFLTFSDRRGEEKKQEGRPLTVNDFKEMLKKKISDENLSMSKFGIDIRATVTPQTLFTLVMDPAAGDKITARGKGAMQVKYESDDDEMMMYGKYEIEEGNYNFSLQDIILRDFKIKEGSYITFNGNPLTADLDISATYRVNTNLSDLDKSFSTDRDLNRTNVPVDAVLSVEGDMQNPDITFDIELPTLTQDVERKVKSIISTDDMMNRQIIYLLALNRFYTPEYMGATGNGGELAAVASSTISSQLSNIMGQLTDKFSLAPSFRSDKGDFSDIEVDVALSSRLLNNRLLINGNFGYRDRSNSSTTFVGDFDVEYLLSKNGNLRLKAYNHFNDQNYYLREALTTQGLGIVYRKDFDDWFTFLKKYKKAGKEEEKKEVEEENISPSIHNEEKDGTQD